jgi:hypothetical protein
VFTPRPVEATSAQSNGSEQRPGAPRKTNGITVPRPVEGQPVETGPIESQPADDTSTKTPPAPAPEKNAVTVARTRRTPRKAAPLPSPADSPSASSDETTPATNAADSPVPAVTPRRTRKTAGDQAADRPAVPARRAQRKTAPPAPTAAAAETAAAEPPTVEPAVAEPAVEPAGKPRKRTAAPAMRTTATSAKREPPVDTGPAVATGNTVADTPAKTPRSRKRAMATAAAPVEPAATTPATVPSYAEMWAAVRDRPHRTPAALALAAVAHYGSAAGEQAGWLRETYPSVGVDRLARVAIRDAQRRARVATAAAVLPLGGLASIATQLWTHARLVLEIAALHRVDPREPARAAEILALLEIYPDVGAASAAVRGLTDDADAPTDNSRNAPALPKLGAVATTLVRSGVSRAVPGAGVVLAGLAGAASVADVAARAVRFYGAAR